jgi:integrase
LELLLLTCCPRTGEVIPATWGEIDGDRWNVPAAHMKSGVARTIPLSKAAIDLLATLRPADANPSDFIFPSRIKCASGRLGDGAMQDLMRDVMKVEFYNIHGFRSSFMDWVAEHHPDRLLAAEKCLDHTVGGKIQQAYLRTGLIEPRRALAELWSIQLQSATVPSCSQAVPALSLDWRAA